MLLCCHCVARNEVENVENGKFYFIDSGRSRKEWWWYTSCACRGSSNNRFEMKREFRNVVRDFCVRFIRIFEVEMN